MATQEIVVNGVVPDMTEDELLARMTLVEQVITELQDPGPEVLREMTTEELLATQADLRVSLERLDAARGRLTSACPTKTTGS